MYSCKLEAQQQRFFFFFFLLCKYIFYKQQKILSIIWFKQVFSTQTTQVWFKRLFHTPKLYSSQQTQYFTEAKDDDNQSRIINITWL